MSRDRFGILSTRQLRDMLEDEEKLCRMVQLSPQLQTLQLEREIILASNWKMAEDNLNLQPQLDDKKLHLARKYQELQEVTAVYEDKRTKLAAYLERYSPKTALEILQREAVKTEEESEEITDTFLAGKVSLESFLERFHRTRKVCHMRKTQVEKLQDLIKKDRKKNQQHVAHQRLEHRVASHNVPPRPQNGPTAHRLYQRSGFVPAIEVTSQAASPFSMPSPPPQSKNLPPLSSRERQPVVSRPNTPFTPQGLRSGLRILGQLPIWTPRPFKLQQAHPVQKQPPYR
ncbi:vacuolar protein sorting-associated protein 37D [Hemiscyllium ocellatum]|uniref:vacuolar protein sorting-associated protein 37D n=1 Tax=Hemiscyllium ocellatum TaxID=170820 RepID=UPI00296671DE|nr:vacuolar protein sorting-associated protein 37D [Hemiscyllium ocellatum]